MSAARGRPDGGKEIALKMQVEIGVALVALVVLCAAVEQLVQLVLHPGETALPGLPPEAGALPGQRHSGAKKLRASQLRRLRRSTVPQHLVPPEAGDIYNTIICFLRNKHAGFADVSGGRLSPG